MKTETIIVIRHINAANAMYVVLMSTLPLFAFKQQTVTCLAFQQITQVAGSRCYTI
jgi:hypothetical protein